MAADFLTFMISRGLHAERLKPARVPSIAHRSCGNLGVRLEPKWEVAICYVAQERPFECHTRRKMETFHKKINNNHQKHICFARQRILLISNSERACVKSVYAKHGGFLLE